MTAPATLTDILAALNAACREPGGQARLARRAGVSRAFVNAVINNKRDVTESIVNALGFVRTVSYRRITP